MLQTIVNYTAYQEGCPADTKHTVERSILSFLGIPMPKDTYTGFYGSRRTLHLMSPLIQHYKARGQSVSVIELAFETSIRPTECVGYGEGDGAIALSETIAINLFRLTKRVKPILLQAWREVLGSKFDDEDPNFQKNGTIYPHMIGKLREHPVFSHINLFIYKVRIEVPAKGQDEPEVLVVPVCTVWGKPESVKALINPPGTLDI